MGTVNTLEGNEVPEGDLSQPTAPDAPDEAAGAPERPSGPATICKGCSIPFKANSPGQKYHNRDCHCGLASCDCKGIRLKEVMPDDAP